MLPSEKKFVYLISLRLENIYVKRFIVNSIFKMEEVQIIELGDQILEDAKKSFVQKSIEKMDSEDLKDGKDLIVQNMKLKKDVQYEFLGFMSSFNLKEQNININVTGETKIISTGKIGSQKRISGT